MSKTDTKVKIKPNVGLQEPPLFKIIYINDDVTTMEFVVGSLVDYFNYTLGNKFCTYCVWVLKKNFFQTKNTLLLCAAGTKNCEISAKARKNSDAFGAGKVHRP